MVVVEVQVRREPALALDRRLVREAIGPFTQQCLDEALDLPVGLRAVGFDAQMADPGGATDVAEPVRHVG